MSTELSMVLRRGFVFTKLKLPDRTLPPDTEPHTVRPAWTHYTLWFWLHCSEWSVYGCPCGHVRTEAVWHENSTQPLSARLNRTAY